MNTISLLRICAALVLVGAATDATAAEAKKKKPPVPAPAVAAPKQPGTPATPTAATPTPAPAPPAAGALTAQQSEFFEGKIRPLLSSQCYKCHSAAEGKTKGGLALDTRDGWAKGGEHGPAIVPGSPEKSLLIKAVSYKDADLQMPPKGEKLSGSQLADLEQWVKMGAPDPRTGAAGGKYASTAQRKAHWAFQPVKNSAVPELADPRGGGNAVDSFILAKLADKEMKPNALADKRTLIRRAYFDLIGLPPTPEEVEKFVTDSSSKAYENLIDRLLASPQYGERWGRHWLDVARYSDTKGDPAKRRETPAYPFAWTYRDYVIKSFNEDKPFNRFILEQIAADRLPLGNDKTTLAALGFLTLGDHFNGNQNDIINDRIDVVTKGFQVLTVTCARCHDHMFDPIPTKDYYSLHGVFASSMEPREDPIIGPPLDKSAYQDYLKERAELEKTAAGLKGKAGQKGADKKALQKETLELRLKLDALDAKHAGAPVRAMVLEDAPKPHDSPVFIRGEAENKGDSVPRRYLEIVAGPNRQPFKFGSGRLELAQSIANKNNPLTARVLINRIWMHHFGEGFVSTPDDFGTMSAPPSHPELLDYLATWFMDNGWSIKKVHKLIMLSNTYQQSSANNPRYAQADPYNRLLWRSNIRRLEFEPLRDSLLAMGGTLDKSMGGRPVSLGNAEGPQRGKANGKLAQALRPTGYSTRRTVYGYIDRASLPEVLNHFDFANPELPSGRRYETTVPQQALFLMNSPLVIEQARNIVERADFKSIDDADARIKWLYALIFQRPPNPVELKLGLNFFEDAPSSVAAKPAEAAPQRPLFASVGGGAAKGAQKGGPFRPGGPGSAAMAKPLTTWAEYAHALFLSNEASFVN